MEKLQGPINPCLVGGDVDVGWLEEFLSNNSNIVSASTNTNSCYRFEQQQQDPYNSEECGGGNSYFTLPSLEHKMPFLQMLQSVEPPPPRPPLAPPLTTTTTTTTTTFPFMQEPNYFQLLLRLQHQKLMLMDQPNGDNNNNISSNDFTCHNEHESCVSMDMQHSPVKSESDQQGPQFSTLVSQSQLQNCDTNVEQVSASRTSKGKSKRAHLLQTSQSSISCYNHVDGRVNYGDGGGREKRKRKRSVRPAKNQEEAETQRMTHIAVERNRRRQMNDHLTALRSLMPSSYVQRGDQASIIGGAIDFVKELEQMLQSLQAQKRMRQSEESTTADVSAASSSTTSSSSNLLNNVFMTSPTSPFDQFRSFGSNEEAGNGDGNSTEEAVRIRRGHNSNNNEEFSAENRSALADIEVVVIQNHVNLKIQCQRRPGQLLKAILAFEELRLTILHLNISSLHSLVYYSFNLKIEDDCKLGSADDVARAVHQIFSLINLS